MSYITFHNYKTKEEMEVASAYILKLLKFYKLNEYNRICIDFDSHRLGAIAFFNHHGGSWNDKEKKFYFNEITIGIVRRFYEKYIKKGKITLEEILLHEFCHVMQMYRFGFTPPKYHDQMFYMIGNEFNSNFEKNERLFHCKKITEEERNKNEKYMNILYKNKRFLRIERKIYDITRKPTQYAGLYIDKDYKNYRKYRNQANSIRSQICASFNKKLKK